jgi:UDP-glucuronate 4-epimerase
VPARLYNLGNSRTEELGRFVEILEEALGRTAVKELLPLQPGDVAVTSADIEASRRDLGFEPAVVIEDGLRRFVDWYRDYRGS